MQSINVKPINKQELTSMKKFVIREAETLRTTAATHAN